jgi:hypothetical protein
MRLGVPKKLERVLSSTNRSKKLFSRMRDIGHRVKHWQKRHDGAPLDRGRRALTRNETQFDRSHRGIDATRKAASLNYVAAAQYQQRIAHHWP